MIDKKEAQKYGIKAVDSKESSNALFDTLKDNFPETIKDNKVDLRAIAMLLGINDKANTQGYELTFTGKALANELYNVPTQKMLTLKESFFTHTQNEQNTNQTMRQDFGDKNGALQKARELPESVMTEAKAKQSLFLAQKPTHTSMETQNAIIKGDNLDVLKILKASYNAKIKMIYIDPPYNTKNDNFIYPDNFRKDYKEILQAVGLLEIDENGNEIESDTLQFFKSIQSTRTHSGWLAFMLPRLKLARDLLREDGVIFISIDDNEQANLKILCDEIFGEGNFVSSVIWLKGNAQNDAYTIQTNHEYILCYAKNTESKPIYKIKQEVKEKAFKDEKIGKFYYEGAGLTMGGGDGGSLENRPNLGYTFYYNPQTNDIKPLLDYDKDSVKTITNHDELYNNNEELMRQGYVPIRPPKMGVGNGCWKWALEMGVGKNA